MDAISRSGIFLVVVLSIAVAASSAVASGVKRRKKPVLVVLPFTSPHRFSAMGRNAQSTFVTGLIKTRRVRVVQPDMVARILNRHGLRWTGVLDAQMLRSIGRRFKAKYVMAGKLRWVGDVYTLSVHVMDVRTLETTFADDVDFSSVRKMRIATRLAARRITAQIVGVGSQPAGQAEMFISTNARAFYDAAAACVEAVKRVIEACRFRGEIVNADATRRTITIKGDGLNALKKGVPLDVLDPNTIDGPTSVGTAYVTKIGRNIADARFRVVPKDGMPLIGSVSNEKHQWTVAVGRIVDQAENDVRVMKRFREALLRRIADDDVFKRVDTTSSGVVSLLRDRIHGNRYARLVRRGIELVLEGKFYGTKGSRRAILSCTQP